MLRGFSIAGFALALLAPLCTTAWAAANATLEKIRTPRGITLAFILVRPDNPVASVILFAGGHGGLGLQSTTSMAWGKGNFLVRTRERFAAQGLTVAVVDSPPDHKQMNGIFRMSADHASDIEAVVAHLKKRADVPVWLVGTSMGTFSAAGGAIRAKGVDGLVLSSTITRSNPDWLIASSHPDGVASMALSKVTVPTLILSHRKDGCDLTPAADTPKLASRLTKAARVEIALLDGGSPPQSEACDAYSQHGFFGIEEEAVGAIARFIKANRGS